MLESVEDLKSEYETQLPLEHSFTEVSDEEIAVLKRDILEHVKGLNLPSWPGRSLDDPLAKDSIRAMHSQHREQTLHRELAPLKNRLGELLECFANGRDVIPSAIDPELVPVKSDERSGDLFRLATLLWSIPVSKGYGRRIRYLVRDRSNKKLIGVFGLTDPVFNLRARDEWIGWNVNQRRAGLVHVMDAYVLGSVPPYSYLLGGKLVASLIGSAEVNEAFAQKYAEKAGIISERQKSARLTLVTVTSALGRSSLYNRLRLVVADGDLRRRRILVELNRIGWTEGYGHFHLSDAHFRRLRDLLSRQGHHYANGHAFGQGPNWRIRLSRVGLSMLGIDPQLLKHGIAREIFAMPLAHNTREFLRGDVDDVHLDRPPANEIANAALRRWVLPRASRSDAFASFDKSELVSRLT